MTLGEWMDDRGLNQCQAADYLGIDQTTVSRIVRGQRCSDDVKIRIIEKTEGKVTANDLLGIV